MHIAPRPASSYSLIVFDLDGTLTKSKQPIDQETTDLLIQLLGKKRVAIISGAGFPQFNIQILKNLPASSPSFTNLTLLPTSGTKFYSWRGVWNEVYAEHLAPKEKERILSTLKLAINQTGVMPNGAIYGDLIEDRGSQITYSGLGQSAPLDLKSAWDPTREKREKIADVIRPKIPEYDIRIGGATSIDITRRGINKAFGIRKLEEYLKIPAEQILFVGDALFQGGNDFPAKATGVDCVQVDGPEETKMLIKSQI